ncbi:response regulator [Nitratireductor basaltis]|uniref:Response regulator receiver protein n=1 Tax=Nitratireductor basaltis TaxID=472175 RepID=A0A084U8Z2_9HYPH|nr:response regulator [Nitratireductor basaltis]KFB09428.1 Response regulator receiver protein [Nitratireductor basaltis]
MKRCLIVDDSSVIRKVAKRILTASDMLVAEAATGQEAYEICLHEMPEIIILDSLLPDVESAELIGRILALDPANKPHILLCCSELDIGPIMRAKRAGASGYMLKPFTRAQLLENFRELKLTDAA